MSVPSERDMPIIPARWNGKVWKIELPGSVTKNADTRRGVERIVKRDAPGSAIRFIA